MSNEKELIRRTAKEIIASLPAECYSVLNTDPNKLIKIKAGSSGYFGIDTSGIHPRNIAGKTMKEYANELNSEMGVSDSDVAAMEIGSMFGWDCPGADPLNN